MVKFVHMILSDTSSARDGCYGHLAVFGRYIWNCPVISCIDHILLMALTRGSSCSERMCNSCQSLFACPRLR